MKFSNNFELGKYFTFESDKTKPIYNWFYYKEAFSSNLVEYFLKKFEIKENVLDIFSGVGTTCLCAKSKNLQAYGIDSSPLAVFVAQVKTRDYSQKDLDEIRLFMGDVFQEKTELKFNWNFELFSLKKAFPPRNLRDILLIRKRVEQIENQKTKDFLLLALLSIIPMCSFVLKDGGVLKIIKKSAAPVKEMFKRKVKKMLKDLENPITGIAPEIYLGNSCNTRFENESIRGIITSPPYLNNIDYTKVYGVELSLLEIENSNIAKKTRENSIRSAIGLSLASKKIPEEVGEIGYRIPIIGAYFSDMEKILKESNRILKTDSYAVFVVGNTIIHNTYVFVDEILGQIAERLGFECEILVGLERTADIKPAKIKTRESAVILRKS